MRLQSRDGSLLLMTFYVIVAMVAVGAAFAVMMVNDRLSSMRQLRLQQADAIAQAGLEHAIYELRKDYRSSFNWADGNINGAVVTQSSDEYYEFIGVTNLANGQYRVWLKNVTGESGQIWVKSQGESNGAIVTWGMYLKGTDASGGGVIVVMAQKS